MTPPADIQMNLKSHPRLLSSVRSMLISLAERVGFGEVESGHVALAVDEALANIIRHGYQQRDDESIELNVWVLKDPAPGIRIVIEDEAPQVDPDLMKGRDLDDVRPGGLGVHIMHQVMDNCRFERRESKGMRVIMDKMLVKSAADGQSERSGQRTP
jgi:anti-sigma regulatory factor (Ser/Thr protein kinase)